jgi:hypothetical protein
MTGEYMKYKVGDAVYVVTYNNTGVVTDVIEDMYFVSFPDMLGRLLFSAEDLCLAVSNSPALEFVFPVCQCGCVKFYGASWPLDKHDAWCPMYRKDVV